MATSWNPNSEGPTSGNDTASGDSNNDSIYGGSGADDISGGGGNDYIVGELPGQINYDISRVDLPATSAPDTTDGAFISFQESVGIDFDDPSYLQVRVTSIEDNEGPLQFTINGNVTDLSTLVASGDVILESTLAVDSNGNLISGTGSTTSGTVYFTSPISSVLIEKVQNNGIPGGTPGGAGEWVKFSIFDGSAYQDVTTYTDGFSGVVSDASTPGDDNLTGGTGNDTFVWDGSGNDTITDFGTDDGGAGDGDRTNNDFVDLSDIFNSTTLATYNFINSTSFSTPLQALNHDLSVNGAVNFNGTDMTGPTLTMTGITGGLAEDQVNVACFAFDTLITTSEGRAPIDDLSVGDLVLTRDRGYQPIRWIGSTRLSRGELEARPNLFPIRIRAGSLGQNTPEKDLLVSPQHRVLVRSRVAEAMFGTSEVLIAANKLLMLPGIDIDYDADGVVYYHMLFEQHEVVCSDGAWTESLFTGPEALKTVPPEAVEEMLELFPNLLSPDYVPQAARYIPEKGKQMKKLVARLHKNNKPVFEPE